MLLSSFFNPTFLNSIQNMLYYYSLRPCGTKGATSIQANFQKKPHFYQFWQHFCQNILLKDSFNITFQSLEVIPSAINIAAL